MKEEKYTIRGPQVQDNVNGFAYNLTNKYDAEKLYTTLTAYEEKLELYENITRKIEELTLNLIDLQLKVSSLQVNVDNMKEELK